MNNKINLVPQSSTNWADLFGISSGLTGLEASVVGGGVNGALYVVGFWTGSGAITLSNYNAFPIGSIIYDHQAFKTHYKTAATTWKSSAAAS